MEFDNKRVFVCGSSSFAVNILEDGTAVCHLADTTDKTNG